MKPSPTIRVEYQHKQKQYTQLLDLDSGSDKNRLFNLLRWTAHNGVNVSIAPVIVRVSAVIAAEQATRIQS